MINWIDKTERNLIIKYFNIDPVEKIDINSNDYFLGYSDYYNIIDFYKFEYKPKEHEFWQILYPLVEKLPNKELKLEMSKVNVGYFWLDYVTKVDINYNIVYNDLLMNVQQEKDLYYQSLILICNMMFISDFNEVKEEYKNINTEKSWSQILNHTRNYEQSFFYRPI
jgi:hypothetical protein